MGRRGAVCSPWVQAVCSQMSVHFYGGRLGPRHHYGSRCRLCPCCPAAQSCSTLATPWTVACRASLSFMISWSLLRFTSSESVMPCNHLILCHPLLLPSIFPSTGVFSSELALCIRWPKYQSFSFSITSSSEYSGLISFRIDWFDLLAVQGALKNLLQHHNLKASILW